MCRIVCGVTRFPFSDGTTSTARSAYFRKTLETPKRGNLITRLNVDTDRLLMKSAGNSEVPLVIQVATKPTSIIYGNIDFIA